MLLVRMVANFCLFVINEMAALSDCFSLGSTVWCRTCYNQEVEGEVLAFDPQTKVLILKCSPTSTVMGLNDVHFINLSLVSELQVKKEVTSVPEIPQSLNLQRINSRIRNQVDEKKRLLTSMSSSVTPEGQRLFVTIGKTIKDIRWRNTDIVVWDQQVGCVVITPPYQLEDIQGNSNSMEYSYIRKVVEKHMKDTALNSSQNQQVIQHNSNSQ